MLDWTHSHPYPTHSRAHTHTHTHTRSPCVAGLRWQTTVWRLDSRCAPTAELVAAVLLWPISAGVHCGVATLMVWLVCELFPAVMVRWLWCVVILSLPPYPDSTRLTVAV